MVLRLSEVATSPVENGNVNYGNNKKITFSVAQATSNDKFEYVNSHTQPVDISFWRLAFNYLDDAQIDEINRTGRLPSNAKFVSNGAGGYEISNNFFGIRTGTHKIPEGYELKRSIFGFTMVVPKDTEGLLIRK